MTISSAKIAFESDAVCALLRIVLVLGVCICAEGCSRTLYEVESTKFKIKVVQTNGGATTDFGTYVTYNQRGWGWFRNHTLFSGYHEDSVSANFLDANTVCISDVDLWRDDCGGEGRGTILTRLDSRAIRPFVFCESGPTIDVDPAPFSKVQANALAMSLHKSLTVDNQWILYCRFVGEPQFPEVVIFSGAEKVTIQMDDSLSVTSNVTWVRKEDVAVFHLAFDESGRQRTIVTMAPKSASREGA